MADIVAYVLIKTELGAAADVAARVVSGPDGVHWAAVVTGPYDVIVGVRVSDNEALGKLVVEGIQSIAEVTETMTAVMSSFHRAEVEGVQQVVAKGVHGPP